jgi:hypothetical protein
MAGTTTNGFNPATLYILPKIADVRPLRLIVRPLRRRLNHSLDVSKRKCGRENFEEDGKPAHQIHARAEVPQEIQHRKEQRAAN